MLVVDEVWNVVMVAAPRVCHLFWMRIIHHSVHPYIVGIQNIVKLFLEFGCDNVHTFRTILNLLHKRELFLYICLLLSVFGLDGLFKYVVSMQHRQPLKPWHELIHNLAHFVAVCHTSRINFDIILSKQALWLKIYIFNVKTALAELRLCIWSILRNGLVKVVVLWKALSTV